MVLPIPKSCSVAEWTIIPASRCQIGLAALHIIRYTYYTVEASFKINQQKTNKKKEITRFLFLVFSSIESFLV
jgi:hypothetical protein